MLFDEVSAQKCKDEILEPIDVVLLMLSESRQQHLFILFILFWLAFQHCENDLAAMKYWLNWNASQNWHLQNKKNTDINKLVKN